MRELAELIEQGHEIGEGMIAAVTSALDQHHSPAEILEDVVRRHRAQGRAQDGQPEALRRLHPAEHGYLRHRPGRHGQDVPGGGAGGARACAPRGQPHHPHAPRSRRASASIPPGDMMAKIDPYLRPLFDALHDMIDPEKVAAHPGARVIEVAPSRADGR